MIEDRSKHQQRDRRLASRRGLKPSSSLRRHFVALARQVTVWDRAQRPDSICGLKLGVTSLNGGAGRSTISFNLAAALAALGRSPVLLVESDFGKHYVTRRLGCARSPGLGELVAGSQDLADVVHATPVVNLSVMGCGQTTDRDALELPFDQFPAAFEGVGNRYRNVVFDLPVANHLTAFYSIAPFLDGVVLAVESQQIDQRQVERFRRQVENQNVPIVGVVINKS